MRKMKPAVQVDVLGMKASGSTKAEATETAQKQIRRLIADMEDAPVLVTCGDIAILAWRSKNCWTSSFIAGSSATPPNGQLRRGELRHGVYQSYDSDRMEFVISVIRHAVQLAWHHGIENDVEWCRRGVEQNRIYGMSDEDVRKAVAECVYHASFQRSYKAHLDSGCSPAEAHNRACMLRQSNVEEAMLEKAA